MPPDLSTDQIERDETPQLEPKQIVTILSRPNHRLFQLGFRAELASGPLAVVSLALNALGISVLNASMSSADGKVGSWNVFLDCKDYGITAEAIRPRLEHLPCLTNLRITQGDELVVDELFFPTVDSMGNRAMIFTQQAFGMMLTTMDSLLGSGESVVAYQEGRAVGSAYAAGIRPMLRGDPRAFLGQIAKIYTAMGIGVCEIVWMDLDELRGRIRFLESIECSGKRSDRPKSQWLRGHLAGGASSLLDTPMQCVERRCVAMGHDYCEFELSREKGC